MISLQLQQALQRLRDGICTSSDLEVVRAALQSGQIRLSTPTPGGAIGGSGDAVLVVIRDGNVLQRLRGTAANQVKLADLTVRYLRAVIEDWQYLTVLTRGEDRRVPLTGVFIYASGLPAT